MRVRLCLETLSHRIVKAFSVVSLSLMFLLPAATSAQDVGSLLLERIEGLVAVDAITPEFADSFVNGGRVDADALQQLNTTFTALAPMEFCCNNTGTCTCSGQRDCTYMSWFCAEGTQSCDTDGTSCTCTEAGPTFCPFDECCTSSPIP